MVLPLIAAVGEAMSGVAASGGVMGRAAAAAGGGLGKGAAGRGVAFDAGKALGNLGNKVSSGEPPKSPQASTYNRGIVGSEADTKSEMAGSTTTTAGTSPLVSKNVEYT